MRAKAMQRSAVRRRLTDQERTERQQKDDGVSPVTNATSRVDQKEIKRQIEL